MCNLPPGGLSSDDLRDRLQDLKDIIYVFADFLHEIDMIDRRSNFDQSSTATSFHQLVAELKRNYEYHRQAIEEYQSFLNHIDQSLPLSEIEDIHTDLISQISATGKYVQAAQNTVSDFLGQEIYLKIFEAYFVCIVVDMKLGRL